MTYVLWARGGHYLLQKRRWRRMEDPDFLFDWMADFWWWGKAVRSNYWFEPLPPEGRGGHARTAPTGISRKWRTP